MNLTRKARRRALLRREMLRVAAAPHEMPLVPGMRECCAKLLQAIQNPWRTIPRLEYESPWDGTRTASFIRYHGPLHCVLEVHGIGPRMAHLEDCFGNFIPGDVVNLEWLHRGHVYRPTIWQYGIDRPGP